MLTGCVTLPRSGGHQRDHFLPGNITRECACARTLRKVREETQRGMCLANLYRTSALGIGRNYVRLTARIYHRKLEVTMDDRTRDDLDRDDLDRDRDRDRDMADKGVENQVKGTAKEWEGKVRSKAADVVDDRSEQLKGKAQEVKGKAQKNFGKAQERMGDKDRT
jgi:uncharacterized protein YjbJ (UPF0337 family)